jgi:endonuclease YncB( thermonuclease family)
LSVTDGDTLIVQRHGTSERIRLRGIDCPEKDQPFGKEATSFTRDATLEHEVGVKEWGHDKYNRTLGDIILSDGRILNQELVRAGMCWWYRKYSDDQTLSILEAEAHAAHRGLWAAEEQVPPWEWRKRHKNKSGNEVVP